MSLQLLPLWTSFLVNERFATMSANYENEQKALKESFILLKADIEVQEDKTASESFFTFVKQSDLY